MVPFKLPLFPFFNSLYLPIWTLILLEWGSGRGGDYFRVQRYLLSTCASVSTAAAVTRGGRGPPGHESQPCHALEPWSFSGGASRVRAVSCQAG